jgi:hypothetical protein
LGVYKVQETTKEEFVTNAVQVEMHIVHHVAKATNATAAY